MCWGQRGGVWMRWKGGGWPQCHADTAAQLSETCLGYIPHRGKCVCGVCVCACGGGGE